MAGQKYKLTYFDIRSRGEPIRLLFALAKVPYQDVRIPMAEWPKHKANTPWGSLPILEVDGNLPLAQHCTIGRFLAKRFKLAGTNEVEEAKCDEIVDAATDLLSEQISHQVAIFIHPDEKKAAEVRTNLVEVLNSKLFREIRGDPHGQRWKIFRGEASHLGRRLDRKHSGPNGRAF